MPDDRGGRRDGGSAVQVTFRLESVHATIALSKYSIFLEIHKIMMM